MTYNVFGGTLSLTQSISHFHCVVTSLDGTSAMDCLQRLSVENDLLHVEWDAKLHSLSHSSI